MMASWADGVVVRDGRLSVVPILCPVPCALCPAPVLWAPRNNNQALWTQYMQPKIVLEMFRNVVANRLATDGLSWAQTFQKWNSGVRPAPGSAPPPHHTYATTRACMRPTVRREPTTSDT
jgi:hypothetical protein